MANVAQQDMAQNANGALELVWIGTDGHARHTWQDANGNWNQGDHLLGPAGYVLDVNEPISVGRDEFGHLVVIAYSAPSVGAGRVRAMQVDGWAEWTSV